MTYGPFAPIDGQHLPESAQLRADLAHIRRLGTSAIRLYHLPTRAFLDEAAQHDLRVMVDVPWDKHRCFLEDYPAQVEALGNVRRAAAELGTHPALFAISVANEIPQDVVRFHGARRVERFIEELIDCSKQAAPDCLVTYTNYPSTEFLTPRNLDFLCFNVYLDDADVLGGYLDRLQHVAGPLPLVLGEYGLDSLRNGRDRQADALRRHIEQVFGHGLAGSFVFAYTDDWFTGGHQITDWAFGVTDSHRVEKPAALAVADAWSRAGHECVGGGQRPPRVSVVVCSYNGSATLDECLLALRRLEYPDYEVILIDDGSTDDTPAIASRFPEVRYVRQPNRGLSAARNRGAEFATGEIVAYTDDDCVPDEAWLLYLVRGMIDQGVDVIGGPNVPPPSDAWTAKCVAASPGGPSHVMLDDRRAEHVPGCNIAFRRERLLAMGGFDVRFRQAGDDVDVCWRFLDAGMSIGYAPAGMVWHHRRSTVRAYLKQQKGYGRSEAMLHFKHPQRFNKLGCSRWHGVIYGEGAVGLPVHEPVVYHGRFGSGLFQIVYRRNDYSAWAYVTLLEWHVLALMVAGLSLAHPGLLGVAAAMVLLSLFAGVRAAWRAELPRGAPWWCRPVVGLLHLTQPVVRSWHRYLYRLRNKRVPALFAMPGEAGADDSVAAHVKRIGLWSYDMYWTSDAGRGREGLLDALAADAQAANWHGDFSAEWEPDDLALTATPWHGVRLRAATEELGWPKRFTRVRWAASATVFARVLALVIAVGLLAAIGAGAMLAAGAFGAAAVLWAVAIGVSARRCRAAVARLVWRAGTAAQLKPVLTSRRGAAAEDRSDLRQSRRNPSDRRGSGGAFEALDDDAAPAGAFAPGGGGAAAVARYE